MKRKLFICLVTIIGLSLVSNTALGVTLKGYGSIIKTFPVCVGDPDKPGTVTLKIDMYSPAKPGTTKVGPKLRPEIPIDLSGDETPKQKAEKIAKALNKFITDNKIEGSASVGENGELIIDLPASLKPKLELLDTQATGERTKSMSEKELDAYLLGQVNPPPDGEEPGGEEPGGEEPGGEEPGGEEPDGDDPPPPGEETLDPSITNSLLNSIIIMGTPSGTWNGIPGDGVLNVSIGLDNYSIPTQGLTAEQLAIMILNHYAGLGYEVTLTGDAVTGFAINTGYYCPSVQGYDDDLVVGLRMEIEEEEEL
jgi:hypothetical protein